MKPGLLRAAMRPMLHAALAACAPVSALAQVTQAAGASAVNHIGRAAAATGTVGALGAGSAVPSLGAGAILQTLFGLAVVIGLVFGAAWLARRLGLQPSSRGGLLRVVSTASLGNKERVTVVEIGNTWLVVGTAPGNVRLLHTLPAGAGIPGGSRDGGVTPPGPYDPQGPQATSPGTFAERFRTALSSEAGKRFQRLTSGGR
jgi:flagellar protein FliO/FliZ